MSEIRCLRCGKCCTLPSGKVCKYLRRLEDGSTLCTIYARRYGIDLGEGYYCGNRGVDEHNIIAGCPYNERIKAS